ncbi:MAG TPA: flagellar basal body L-ring protein FlgH [Thiobacillaceae bacterium]|nr:flagellar basal body L-ring protein FlgH [Thiobacillaceae bacterium]HNU62977.1 flagellar basal body L-ring protein FlgH [Thiobacillaceae bacterium]
MRPLFIALSFLSLTGCVSGVPETRIQQPLSMRPQAAPPALENGAIFQTNAVAGRPGMNLFDDRRARRVGDTLTVLLVEKTEAKRKSETTDERKANARIDIPKPLILGRNPPMIGATAWDVSAGNKIELKDNETNSNEIKGAITVTVVEVLANGNLLVAGEKQVRINQDTEFIRLGGVVNPLLLSANNTISSTQLADVQLESTNSQQFDKSQLAGLMARFFLTLLPF